MKVCKYTSSQVCKHENMQDYNQENMFVFKAFQSIPRYGQVVQSYGQMIHAF